MKKTPLILLGGGGHCKSCIDVIEQEGRYEIVGVLDLPERKSAQLLPGYNITGTDQDLLLWKDRGVRFLVTAGQIKDASLRMTLFEKAIAADLEPAIVMSPHSALSKFASVQEGSILMHGAQINANATIGKNCIVNSMANVEHDSVVGNHVHISTGAQINGGCLLGDGSFIGSGAVVVNGVRIGPGVVIGAGSVVNRDCQERGIYAGNPAKKLK